MHTFALCFRSSLFHHPSSTFFALFFARLETGTVNSRSYNVSDTLRSRRPPSCCCRRPAARRGALPARLRDAGRPGTRPRGWFALASTTRVNGACASAEELGSRRPGVRVEVSRRDRLEPTPDPCPHAVCAAHAMVARLDPHAECSMLHALTGCCRAPAACHRWMGEARIDMLKPSKHAQTHHL